MWWWHGQGRGIGSESWTRISPNQGLPNGDSVGGVTFVDGKKSRRNVRNPPDVCFLKATDRHKLSGTALPSDLIFAIKFLLTEPKP